MSPSYPVHLRLAGRRVLVAGAGRVATRKVERLVESGAQIQVVAPHASASIQKLSQEGRLALTLRPAVEADADGAFMVIAATDDAAVNAALVRAARARGALGSRVDDATDSDFTVPALARGACVEATVSTGGAAPAASRRLGRELRRWIAHGVDRFATEMAEARRVLAGHVEGPARLRSLGDGELFEACVAGDEARVRALVVGALGESA